MTVVRVSSTPSGAAVLRDRCPAWLPPPSGVKLRPEEVHLWRAPLDLRGSTLERLYDTLADDEKARAARFRFPEGRARFTAARGVLRDILARYAGVEPASLQFDYQPSGKPFLAVVTGAGGLQFNLSHSKGMGLYGVTLGRPVGVDIERIRQGAEFSRIAERFFTSNEAQALRDCPAHLQAEAFFRCWTRKEAFIKAVGKGFALGLGSFEVSIEPGDGDALLGVGDDPAAVERWHLSNVDAPAGFAAAVAVEQRGLAFACWEWLG
jgi:4'-phosphopantetheinyl transferase